MPNYVDGFVVPVPRKKLAAYLKLARQSAKIWREHGALSYRECVGEDLAVKFGRPFPRVANTLPGETVVLAWIEYKSRAHRDRVNAKVMKDPRLTALCSPENTPFDVRRMAYGGFKVVVAA